MKTGKDMKDTRRIEGPSGDPQTLALCMNYIEKRTADLKPYSIFGFQFFTINPQLTKEIIKISNGLTDYTAKFETWTKSNLANALMAAITLVHIKRVEHDKYSCQWDAEQKETVVTISTGDFEDKMYKIAPSLSNSNQYWISGDPNIITADKIINHINGKLGSEPRRHMVGIQAEILKMQATTSTPASPASETSPKLS